MGNNQDLGTAKAILIDGGKFCKNCGYAIGFNKLLTYTFKCVHDNMNGHWVEKHWYCKNWEPNKKDT